MFVQKRRYILVIANVIFASQVFAATLKPETVNAWDAYVQTVNARLQERVQPGAKYLWTFENPERAAKVRAGEFVVSPAGPNPRKIPGGLIHHWIGAMFLPNLTIDQILTVTRDYDRYKEYYRPSVVDSKTIVRGDTGDQFSMRLMNKAFFLKTALDANYNTTNVRLDDRRFYSTSQTTRLQEIEEYGAPGEHKLPEGQGGGYIWKVFSIGRFEQRDSGVYVEMEAVALSRDIPLAARFFVDPIVRRVSRNSLLISLQQTQRAVQENGSNAPARAAAPVGAGRVSASGFTPVR